MKHVRNFKLTNKNFWQVQAQYQCLFLAKKFQVPFVIPFDVDEFIFLPSFPGAIRNATFNPLLALIDSIIPPNKRTTTDVGGLAMNSIPFGRHPYRSSREKPQLLLDYTYRNAPDPWDQPWAREKQILNTPRVWDYAVHYLQPGSGKSIRLNVQTQARLHHFKDGHKGVFKTQGIKKGNLKQDTLMRDLYRDLLFQTMSRTEE